MMVAVFSATPASADELFFTPALSANVGYEDNVRLDPDEQDSQSTLELILEARLGSRTATRDAVLDAVTHVKRYSDSELDTEDWFLNLDITRRWQRDELGLAASYRDASTVTTEIEDTGLLDETRRREDVVVAPSWTRDLGRNSQLSLEYRFTDVRFDQESTTDLVDYREHALETTLGRRLSEATDFSLTADFKRFDSEDGTDADTVGLIAGLERAFTRTFAGSLSLGVNYSESEFPGADGLLERVSETGPLYAVRGTWTLYRSTLTVDAARSVDASAEGSLAETDNLRVSWNRFLSRDWTLNISASASQRDFARTGSRPAEERRFYDAEARLSWTGRPPWQVDLAYRYRRQDFEDSVVNEDDRARTADSNAVWLRVGYN